MSFDLISELTRWTARLSMLVFAAAFLYEGLRNGKPLTRRLWQIFACLQILYFLCLISYHFFIREFPQFDVLNILLSIGTLMFCMILWSLRQQRAKQGRLFTPVIASYFLAFLFAALPISRILPPETDAPIYHVILYAMSAVFILRIGLDIKAFFTRSAASK